MQRLMTQPQGILGTCLIEFIPGRASPLAHQGLVAPEGTQPVAGRGFGRSYAKIRQQVTNCTTSNERKAGRDSGTFHEMLMAVDEARRHHTPRQGYHLGPRADVRLKIGIPPKRNYTAITDGEGVALRMTQYDPIMEYQVSLFRAHRRVPYT
jgi:hypothetical protein